MNTFLRSDVDILDTMAQRHSVRKYNDKKLTFEQKSTLKACIDECNAEGGLDCFLVTDEPEAFSNIAARYGHFEGVANYIVMAGPDTPDLNEKCGYYGERLVLLAQQLKLNTCWVALTFSKRKVRRMLKRDAKLCLVISVGRGVSAGHSHKSRTREDLSNCTDTSPAWFQRGVNAAMLAPTALNQQSFSITLGEDERSVSIVSKGGPYSETDLGIVKHDFEHAAGRENFDWA